jgi:hypothetical protein
MLHLFFAELFIEHLSAEFLGLGRDGREERNVYSN